VTNNIVCSSCGGAGHIARDCRQKRPGAGGPNAAGDKNKIDEEVLRVYVSVLILLAHCNHNIIRIYITQEIYPSDGYLECPKVVEIHNLEGLLPN
jgi:hypothetical protein